MSRQINLYDPQLLRKRDWLALGYVLPAALLLSVAVAAAGFAARGDLPALMRQSAANEVELKALREQLTTLGQQAAARKPDPAIEEEVGAARFLLTAREEVVRLLRKDLGPGSVSYAELLRGLARQSLPGLWLTGFAFDASGGMEIRGRTTDPALLPEYILRLNREPAFQGRAFAALSLSEGKPAAAGQPAPYHEFKLTPRKPPAEGGKAAPPNPTQGGGGPG